MARTTPARTHNFERSAGERRVYEALARLPDRMIVIHSQRLSGEAGQRVGEREADFVIIDPEAGVLVVEVKGGAIACDQGHWLQGPIGATPSKEIHPYEQASRGMHALQGRINAALDAEKVLFGHFVWFPDVDMADAPLPGGTSRDLTLDARHLAAPEAAIDGVFAYWRQEIPWKKGEVGATLAQAMLDYLAPTFACRVVVDDDASPPLQVETPPPAALVPPEPPISPEPPSAIVVATPSVWRPILEKLAAVLLRVGEAVMLAPVHFVMEVVELAADLATRLFRWCWGGLKTGLMVGFACGVMVGLTALVLWLGFHKDGAMSFAAGGLLTGFVGLTGHAFGERLEKPANVLVVGVTGYWRAYRQLMAA